MTDQSGKPIKAKAQQRGAKHKGEASRNRRRPAASAYARRMPLIK